MRRKCAIKNKFDELHQKFSWLKGRCYYFFKLYLPIYRYKKSNDKPVFLLFTPEHANLGDHAIAYAEISFLNSIKIQYYEITNKQLETLNYYKLMSVFNGAKLLITGGGNLGSLWTWIENINRQIILNNPNSDILIFPNSIYYGNSESEQNYFLKSQDIYNNHKNLFLYAREELSYNYMLKAYNYVKLIPDMVLSMDYSKLNLPRKGCILCLRSDREATLTRAERAFIKNVSNKHFDSLIVTDTVLDHYVKPQEREQAINEKLRQFASSELVITDRLHGMIFAAITGTNCIVLDSKSPKLRGCYKWLEHLNYIKFADSIIDIESLFGILPQEKNIYNNCCFTDLFNELKNDLINFCNK